jgi:hypothetical protein
LNRYPGGEMLGDGIEAVDNRTFENVSANGSKG